MATRAALLTLSFVRSQQEQGGRDSAGVVAQQSDVVVVAAEAFDIALDPKQSRDLVIETQVSRCSKIVGRKEA